MKNIENLEDVAVALCPPFLLPTIVMPSVVLSNVVTTLGLSARRHAGDNSVVIEPSYVAFGTDAVFTGIARDKATVDGTPGFRTWSPPV